MSYRKNVERKLLRLEESDQWEKTHPYHWVIENTRKNIENMSEEDKEYTEASGYVEWRDILGGSPHYWDRGVQSDNAIEWTKEGGAYPIYKKGSVSAKAFKKAFNTAKDLGKRNFIFQDRKYNIEIEDKIMDDFIEADNKYNMGE